MSVAHNGDLILLSSSSAYLWISLMDIPPPAYPYSYHHPFFDRLAGPGSPVHIYSLHSPLTTPNSPFHPIPWPYRCTASSSGNDLQRLTKRFTSRSVPGPDSTDPDERSHDFDLPFFSRCTRKRTMNYERRRTERNNKKSKQMYKILLTNPPFLSF
jgi:hypothetical protein